MTKCLTQHHGIHTDLTLYTKTLNAEQHDEALASLIFLLKYRDGRLKARSCADRSKQRRIPGYKKEDSAFPNVSNGG